MLSEQPTKSNAKRLRTYSDGVKSKLDRIEAAVEILPSLVQRLDHLETLITTSVSADRPAARQQEQQQEQQ
jgi:hypothetical protein